MQSYIISLVNITLLIKFLKQSTYFLRTFTRLLTQGSIKSYKLDKPRKCYRAIITDEHWF